MGTINTDAQGRLGWMSDDSEAYAIIEKWPAMEGSNTWAQRIGVPHAIISDCMVELFLYGEHVLDTKQDADARSALKSLCGFIEAWGEAQNNPDSDNFDLFPADLIRLIDYAEEFAADFITRSVYWEDEPWIPDE